MKAESLTVCPECSAPELFRVIHNPIMVSVANDPKTLGHAADRNRDKMSASHMGDKEGERHESIIAGRAHMAGQAEANKAAWYRQNPEAGPNMGLARATDKEKANYIVKGESPNTK
jgi:hypothetical protein